MMALVPGIENGQAWDPRSAGGWFSVGFMANDSFILPSPMLAADAGGTSPFLLEEQTPPTTVPPRPPLSPLDLNNLPFWGSRKRANDPLNEDTSRAGSKERMPEPDGLKTPQNSAHAAEDRTSKILRTPKTRVSWSPVEETPEAKKCISVTPPSGPAMLQKRLEDDIDAALEWQSLPLLSLALSRGHCCGQDHVVFEAVRRQNLRALRFLLQSGQQDVDQQCGGRRPIHLAIQTCMAKEDTSYKMAELLLQNGANPDGGPQDELNSDPPLLDAMHRGCLSGVRLLLKYEANPDARDKDGCTPMHIFARRAIAQSSDHEEALSCLLAHGANPFALDTFGFAPLDYAHNQFGRHEILRAQRWWSVRSLKQVSQLSGESENPRENLNPWSMPEIFETIIGFLGA